MKQQLKIELYEEHEKVNFYTLHFNKENTEFDKFLDRFLDDTIYEEDMDIIIKWIDKIGEEGALERYFRPEGKLSDNICAIPIETCNLRVYVLRLTDDILILGNGGLKKTPTYNEDEELNKIVITLQLIDKFIRDRIEKGTIHIYNMEILGNVDFTFQDKIR